jgi:hypothetical protein
MPIDLVTGPCQKCNLRKATVLWSEGTVAMVHGAYQARCDLCCVEEQLEHARKMAASIPELELRLEQLKKEV